MAKFKIKKKDCLLTVKAGDAGAKADIGVQLYGEDGKLKLNSELVQKLKPPRLSWKAH